MIDIIGYKGISWTSWFIKKFTLGPFSHVEWLINQDTLRGYGAYEKADPGGVGFLGPHMHEKGTPYVIWQVEATPQQEASFEAFMLLQKGKPYDWAGILGFTKFKDSNDPEKWFCSEILTVAFREAKIPFFNWEYTIPGVVAPNRFVLSPMLKKVKEGVT